MKATGTGGQSVERIRKAMAGELPLEGMGERIHPTFANWTAKASDGTAWDLRWFKDGLILIGATTAHRRVGFRAEARTIQQARLQAVRIANLIADGITRED